MGLVELFVTTVVAQHRQHAPDGNARHKCGSDPVVNQSRWDFPRDAGNRWRNDNLPALDFCHPLRRLVNPQKGAVGTQALLDSDVCLMEVIFPGLSGLRFQVGCPGMRLPVKDDECGYSKSDGDSPAKDRSHFDSMSILETNAVGLVMRRPVAGGCQRAVKMLVI